MNEFFSNPEFLRNARIQLRPGRVVAAIVICAAISWTSWYAYQQQAPLLASNNNFHKLEIFHFLLRLQIVVLLIGGGIYELLSVHREKEQNTFDYQRVTRLTSLELGLGKLFGAPIMMYLIVLCLMPAALLSAHLGSAPIGQVAQAYAILLVGCIAYHTLALLISMALGRGVSAIAILPFLLLVSATSIDYADGPTNWTFHQLGPFVANDALHSSARSWQDLFFGFAMPHFLVLMVIYFTLIGWFLLAIVRNLKRDPAAYELYSPAQAFGFALYLNLLVLGFFNWKEPRGEAIVVNNVLTGFHPLPPLTIAKNLSSLSMWIFALLGFVLLRNRERVRRRIKRLGEQAANWWSAFWPAPYAVGGVVLVGIAIIELIRVYRHPDSSEWNWGLAGLIIGFLALWVARDLLYLQWMGLRRTRRPLLAAFLYLIVFYTCVGIVLGVAHAIWRPMLAPFAAALIPSEVLSLEIADWTAHPQMWLAGLALLGAQVLLFVILQRQKLREFLAPASPSASAATPAAPAAPLNLANTGTLIPR